MLKKAIRFIAETIIEVTKIGIIVLALLTLAILLNKYVFMPIYN